VLSWSSSRTAADNCPFHRLAAVAGVFLRAEMIVVEPAACYLGEHHRFITQGPSNQGRPPKLAMQVICHGCSLSGWVRDVTQADVEAVVSHPLYPNVPWSDESRIDDTGFLPNWLDPYDDLMSNPPVN